MKLILENLGPIGPPISIDLGGLIVIAGENDCGKSTIGKVIFSIVQALSNYPIALKRQQRLKYRNMFDSVAINIRHRVDFAKYPELRALLRYPRGGADLADAPFAEIVDQLHRIADLEPAHQILVNRQIQKILKMQEELSEPVSAEAIISQSIFETLRSEFSGEIVNKQTGGDARVSIVDGETKVLEVTLNDEKITSFQGGDPIGFNDATFVEGPAIFQYRHTLSFYDSVGTSVFPSKRQIPFRTIDLSNKLQGIGYGTSNIEETIAHDVEKVYQGKIYYDQEEEEFFLDKGDFKVAAANAASGVKAMAVLELLLKHDYVREDTLLILDEPETNLHPKWQVQYAKAICKLTAAGAKIIVTSHSPYIVESMKAYSAHENSRFYLATRDSNQNVNFFNTLGDISPVIEALSQPLIDMMGDIADDF